MQDGPNITALKLVTIVAKVGQELVEEYPELEQVEQELELLELDLPELELEQELLELDLPGPEQELEPELELEHLELEHPELEYLEHVVMYCLTAQNTHRHHA